MKLIASLGLFVLSVAVSIFILMNGWGLKPASWGWILGGAGFQMLVLCISTILNKD